MEGKTKIPHFPSKNTCIIQINVVTLHSNLENKVSNLDNSTINQLKNQNIMKKLFFLAATLIAAMSMNAEPVVKNLSELGVNFIDFSTEEITAETTVPTSESATWFTTKNNCVCKGFKKSDGSEATNTWNVKSGYQNTFVCLEAADAALVGLSAGDSIKSGTVYRAASGSSIELGAFECEGNDCAVLVFWHPNGANKSEGVKIAMGAIVNEDKRDIADNKNIACISKLEIDADSYAAGEIVISATGNTVNIEGVKIVGLKGATALNPAAVKAMQNKVIVNGQMKVWDGKAWVNMLGF